MIRAQTIAACVCLLAADSASAAETTFFVTSSAVDGSANLGGLEGADRHCQTLARAAGRGDKTWRAYLSAGANAGSAVHARDRIGPGPWKNAKGVVIAKDL